MGRDSYKEQAPAAAHSAIKLSRLGNTEKPHLFKWMHSMYSCSKCRQLEFKGCFSPQQPPSMPADAL